MISVAHLPRPSRVQTTLGPTACAILGEGPPALALHGAMGAWDQGAILGRALVGENTRRIIAPSRPGFPGTPHRVAASPRDQAARMFALLDALGVGSTVVAAISGGGPCAIHMALAQPDRVSALILVSTVTSPNPIEIPKRFATLKAMARVPGLPRLLKLAATHRREAILERSFPNPEARAVLRADPEALALFGALNQTLFDDMATRLRASENDFQVTATTQYPLKTLRVPTLILHGTQDPYAPFKAQALSAAARVPGARLVALDGGGHSALFTHRAQIQAAVEAFLPKTA